ncbi:hypothetical protein CEK26_011726 [Fusarium fujikuroi]|uniref:Uncharacterized protein n=1 Tax=Fusarium fujikuroi TaxID=5127 RepID=A0A5Q3F139_FUSFU|nr:hypothetical protein CEK27_011743 [Fusarium fujikuroi]QGI85006.1 hypothetical protein CEK25_011735 [Fusarium fujikuroi]QGI98657.1 hypothetical protein CEK26_011726 [Fusarium fujikuroi]VTT56554.1 unnamed protein product [Fusarium fujikuroi]VTT72592.1 unnamed protein product [Fusarium fujikuroi]
MQNPTIAVVRHDVNSHSPPLTQFHLTARPEVFAYVVRIGQNWSYLVESCWLCCDWAFIMSWYPPLRRMALGTENISYLYSTERQGYDERIQEWLSDEGLDLQGRLLARLAPLHSLTTQHQAITNLLRQKL